ncbi:MAG: hypothetical protein FD167_1741 [bacterium]|nr:MAG: hypothetical protein FD167_1741 [bacterium]
MVFNSGDSIRFLFNPNVNGYLYIFNTTNDFNPIMVYPHKDLQAGNNKVEAELPFEIPTSNDPNPLRRWIKFDNEKGKENFYIFLCKEPLSNVPIGKDLITYCASMGNDICYWQPTTEMWHQLLNFTSTKSQNDGSKGVVIAQDANKLSKTDRNRTTQELSITKITLQHE